MKLRGSVTHYRAALLVAAAVTLLSHSAGAQDRSAPTPTSATIETRSAAELYDEAVKLFDSAKYAQAAQAFLRADELSPSPEALENAIVSAGRANDHLLVAAAARRAIEREKLAPKLAADARLALSAAAAHLARLVLSCTPEPCALLIDGQAVAPGEHHLIPGTHTLSATGDQRSSAQQRLSLAAGSTHRLELALAPNAAPAPAASPAHPITALQTGPHDRPSRRKPLPKWAFYAGAGVTGGLVTATVWSGVDTLAEAEDYRGSSPRTQSDRDRVDSSARRTDFLLVGSVLAAGLTAYAGMSLVDWSDGTSSLRVNAIQQGTGAAISGTFW